MNLRSLFDDVIGSIRKIRRHPRNPIVVILMLAVAVGSAVGVFDIAYQALHSELPYPQAEKIVVASGKVSSFLVSPYTKQANPSAKNVFEDVAEYHLDTANLDAGSETQRLLIGSVTPRFFSTLGVRMALGGDLPDVAQPAPGSPIPWLPIILSHNLWRGSFGSDRGIVGRAIALKLLYPYRFQVVGVAPAGVDFPPGVDAWIPEHLTSWSSIQTAAPPSASDTAIGRLRPGVSVTAAEAAIRSWPRKSTMWLWNEDSELIPLRQFLVGEFYSLGPLLWLMMIAFLALTVAAAASVFRFDFEGRADEFRVQRILGATPARLFRSSNLELAAVLAPALAAAFLVRSALLRFTAAYLHLPFLVRTSATRTDVILTAGAMGAVAMLIGIGQGHGLKALPFVRAFRSEAAGVGRPVWTGARFRLPVQVVTATMILIAAIVLARGAYSMAHIDLGVNPKGVFVSEVTLPLDEDQYVYGEVDQKKLSGQERERELLAREAQFHAQADMYFSSILQRIRGHRGVTDAGVISTAPYSGYPTTGLAFWVSRTLTQPPYTEKYLSAHMVSIDAAAIPTLGMKLIRGRNFAEHGNASADHDTVLINEAMAERIGPGAASLGQYLFAVSLPPVRIVGILGNVHETNLFTPVKPTVYYPFSQYGLSDVDVIFRTSRNMPFEQAYALFQSSVRSVVPGSATSRFESLNEMVWSTGTMTRYCAYLLLTLALLGVFVAGTCTWAKSMGELRRREHEIGIRLALGAEPRQIVRLIAGSQVRASLVAAVLGAVGAWWFIRLAAHLLYGVSVWSIGNYLLGIAGITAYVLLISMWTLRGTIHRNPRDLIGSRSI